MAGVVAAATWAAGTPPDALAAAVVREATPTPSPVSPAVVAPTSSIRSAVRFIKLLLSDGPSRSVLGRADWPLTQ
ncbi:MAG: hypothetical protein WBZ07_04995 [Candidatus Dormiibacterota bacterium]